MDSDKIKFPIGKLELPDSISSANLESYILSISSFGTRLKKAVETLSETDLDNQYRPGGWTVRQLVHHCAESHMNGFIRMKLALTENEPVILPYNQDAWAQLEDDKKMPIEASIQLLIGLHERWGYLIRSLTTDELQKAYIHPEYHQRFTIAASAGNYAWHCDHHLAHITEWVKAHKNG